MQGLMQFRDQIGDGFERQGRVGAILGRTFDVGGQSRQSALQSLTCALPSAAGGRSVRPGAKREGVIDDAAHEIASRAVQTFRQGRRIRQLRDTTFRLPDQDAAG
jgi:hypothetical protein